MTQRSFERPGGALAEKERDPQGATAGRWPRGLAAPYDTRRRLTRTIGGDRRGTASRGAGLLLFLNRQLASGSWPSPPLEQDNRGQTQALAAFDQGSKLRGLGPIRRRRVVPVASQRSRVLSWLRRSFSVKRSRRASSSSSLRETLQKPALSASPKRVAPNELHRLPRLDEMWSRREQAQSESAVPSGTL